MSRWLYLRGGNGPRGPGRLGLETVGRRAYIGGSGFNMARIVKRVRVSSIPAHRLWNDPRCKAKREKLLEKRDWCDWGTQAQKFYRRGCWQEALDCLTKAIRCNPLDTVSRESGVGDFLMKADCLRRLGRVREAARCEKEAGRLRRLF